MKRFFPIRAKIFFSIFIFMTIPIITLTYLSNRFSIRSLLEQTKINDLQAIDCMQESTDTLLNVIESCGAFAASDPSIIRFFENYYALSAASPAQAEQLNFQLCSSRYAETFEPLLGMSAVSRDHIFIGENVYDQQQLSWYFTRSFFQKLGDDSPQWTSLHMLLPLASDEIIYSLSYVIPVKKSGQLLGYLILYMDRGRLDCITGSLSDTAYVIHDSENGLYRQQTSNQQTCDIISAKLYSSETFNPYTANFYQKSNINYNHLINNNSIITSVNGENLTVTSRQYPRMDWIYLIVSPYTDISRQVLTPLSQMIVIGAASILFALLSASIISLLISRPIYSLNRTIQKIAEGDLSIRHSELTNDEIGALALAFNSLLDRIQELMKNISRQQQAKRNLQLQLIQAQIKPHCLYNVLEMISSFIRDHMDRYALDSISHLASFYRTSLSDGSDIISVRKEIDMIQNYLELQHLRYIEFMDFSLEIEDEISRCQIPKLTLQPIVENAIYHGLKIKCEKGNLRVRGYRKEDLIFFEVYDDGIGMSNTQIDSVMESLNQETPAKDFGISSVFKRLNLYFNHQANITIQSEPGKYTNFILSFPAREISPP